MQWSQRTRWESTDTPWAREFAALKASGAKLKDLTISNPTQCGFDYPSSLLDALHQPGALVYEPHPKGLLHAREAVARYYSVHDASVNPEQIILTTGTSEAYSFLFRLLCDPGDEVLIAQPGYPLLDFLACLDDVNLTPYPLFYADDWRIDLEELRAKVTARTKAIAIVHPNNPTGHYVKADERAAIEAVCREHGLALIVDEVFLDYGLAASSFSFASGEHPIPVFVVSGLSKIAGMPQMKASWIASFGPPAELAEALERLEVIADIFLSLSTPIQNALPSWLEGRGAIAEQIKERITSNLGTLDTALNGQSVVRRLEVEAGWCAVLRVPDLGSGHELGLLRERSVAVHPGGFYGFSWNGWLVISLLPIGGQFTEGVRDILEYFEDQMKDSK